MVIAQCPAGQVGGTPSGLQLAVSSGEMVPLLSHPQVEKEETFKVVVWPLL
jgi:hypothetical protein